jgi:enoyl-CoA hydratase
MNDLVTYKVRDGIATVTLNQPETRNALSTTMLEAILTALERARDEDEARVVVLASSHEKIFSSGGNLGGFTEEIPLVEKHRSSGLFPQIFDLLGQLGKPSICAAGGHVLAGSFGLALACDLIIAREGVRFSTPEIKVGVFPFMIMALIYRNVPRKKTNELLLLGEPMSADEAASFGIVNKVVPSEDFDAAVADWAGRLAKNSPLLTRLGKDAIFRQQDMAFADALQFLRAQLTIAHSTDDMHEGVAAFFAKRDPVWQGR